MNRISHPSQEIRQANKLLQKQGPSPVLTRETDQPHPSIHGRHGMILFCVGLGHQNNPQGCCYLSSCQPSNGLVGGDKLPGSSGRLEKLTCTAYIRSGVFWCQVYISRPSRKITHVLRRKERPSCTGLPISCAAMQKACCHLSPFVPSGTGVGEWLTCSQPAVTRETLRACSAIGKRKSNLPSTHDPFLTA